MTITDPSVATDRQLSPAPRRRLTIDEAVAQAMASVDEHFEQAIRKAASDALVEDQYNFAVDVDAIDRALDRCREDWSLTHRPQIEKTVRALVEYTLNHPT